MRLDDQEALAQAARVESLLVEIESLPDLDARRAATEAVQALLDLYGEGLARIMERAVERGGEPLLDAFAGDELVAHLLLLHGLHPVDLEKRIEQALEEVRPYLRSHGGEVELIGVEAGVARLRLLGSCSGCASSTQTLKMAVEEALYQAAPDLAGIEAEGVVDPTPAAATGFIPASALLELNPHG